ncbi:MAG: hypothetical protein J2P47_16765 [Acetobacteraceae bacterium]|nr:hypothetical protein [Acetobacteraceae bacterium]
MFFLLRMVFWLSLAFLLLPSGAKQTVPGVKTVHDRAAPHDNRATATASTKRARLARSSQDTLTAADLAPAWHGPRDIHKKDGA